MAARSESDLHQSSDDDGDHYSLAMSLTDTLVGGGLSFAGAAAALVYSDWRARALAKVAGEAQRRDRQRDLIAEAQRLVAQINRALAGIAHSTTRRPSYVDLLERTTELAAVASRISDKEVREALLDLAWLVPEVADDLSSEQAKTMGERTGKLLALTGEKIRQLDD
jgi:Ser/Thr protein kinase RdoA (MazF antagonist)